MQAEEHIERDLPECDTPDNIVRADGATINRRNDYWGWLDEVRHQLYTSHKQNI
jgi:hypothetical protein